HRGLHQSSATKPVREARRRAVREAGGAGESGGAQMIDTSPELLGDLDRLRQRSLIAGIAGLALCVVGYFVNPEQFFRSYLVAFVLWNGVALGSLAITLLHHLSGGEWGVVIRRLLEAASRTFPVTLALFLPLTLGLPHLYVWAQPGAA